VAQCNADEVTEYMPCMASKYELTKIARVRAFVRTFCHDLPSPALDEDHISQLELTVNEAVSNLMRHAVDCFRHPQRRFYRNRPIWQTISLYRNRLLSHRWWEDR
jgi:hypothetical protein